ncbi:hypothetical protein C8R45DRAFT_1208206 [Mycena sanguinolenta]|nr:hypothetical protein C8R45DRAFT_1208206 [Mycena sanguinolenta]
MTLSDSPFTSRLNTNYVPSHSEILEIRSLLVDPIEEIARIDAQIEEIELTLTRLRESDVLLEIFLACLPSEHNALIDPTEAPLLLGCVCRHWRSVAYFAPVLWSTLHIPSLDYLNTPPHVFRRFEGIIRAWFERSATCPLSVSLFDFSNHVDSMPNPENHPLALHILAVSRRLRLLALVGNSKLLRPILKLGAGDLPLLKTFRMKALSNQTPSSTNIFDLPNLEDVALSITVSTDPLSLPLQWSKLRILRLECHVHWTGQGSEGGLDFDGALNVLRRCPNLEWCEMRVTKYSEDPGSDRSPIVLPQLHTLALTGWEFRFSKWVSDLVVPNLRSLQIGDLNVLPSRSSHARLSVDIELTRFTSMASLQEFFQSFPMISHLRLVGNYLERMFLDDEFMMLFCPPHNLCPMLTDIGIDILASSRVSDTAALAFIKARMTMPDPLQRFQARFDRPMEFDVMPELQSFILDGLQVNLEYPPPQWKFRAQDGLDEVGMFH